MRLLPRAGREPTGLWRVSRQIGMRGWRKERGEKRAGGGLTSAARPAGPGAKARKEKRQEREAEERAPPSREKALSEQILTGVMTDTESVMTNAKRKKVYVAKTSKEAHSAADEQSRRTAEKLALRARNRAKRDERARAREATRGTAGGGLPCWTPGPWDRSTHRTRCRS